MNLEISLRMRAYRTNFRCFLAYYDMTAVAAFPYLHFALLKYFLRFHIMKQSTVALFMMFFDLRYHT